VHPHDPGHVVAQQLRREVAQRADDDRLHERDRAEQPLLAALDLDRMRVAVAGRPAAQHVGDEDLVAGQPDLAQQRVEQLSGLADERQALLVLVAPGRLADEHQVGVRVARAEDDRVARLRELGTARAAARLVEEGLQRLASLVRGRHTISLDRPTDPPEVPSR
jgi:hypothetical protein